MKLAIIGSNSIVDKEKVFSIIEQITKDKQPKVILGGGGKGTASFVKEFSETKGFSFIEFLPYFLLDNSVEFSNKYFFTRNKQIVENADFVLFIYNGECKDVDYAIKYTQKLKKEYYVYKIPLKEV